MKMELDDNDYEVTNYFIVKAEMWGNPIKYLNTNDKEKIISEFRNDPYFNIVRKYAMLEKRHVKNYDNVKNYDDMGILNDIEKKVLKLITGWFPNIKNISDLYTKLSECIRDGLNLPDIPDEANRRSEEIKYAVIISLISSIAFTAMAIHNEKYEL